MMSCALGLHPFISRRVCKRSNRCFPVFEVFWMRERYMKERAPALGLCEGQVELNAAGAQWAIPTGIERGISVLDRIPVSVKTRGGTSSSK